jgi:hypothetical protein
VTVFLFGKFDELESFAIPHRFFQFRGRGLQFALEYFLGSLSRMVPQLRRQGSHLQHIFMFAVHRRKNAADGRMFRSISQPHGNHAGPKLRICAQSWLYQS